MVDRPDREAWHPAFCAAASFEMREDLDAVEFIPEYNLSKEPLRTDLLIIKKIKDREIKNDIGKILRLYNIVEYKSPLDGLTIDDLYKTIGYACIYKSLGDTVNSIPAGEITISIFKNSYPRCMFDMIIKSGGKIVKKYPGIYYIHSIFMFPVQVVVTSRLDPKNHSGLRILTNKVKKEDAEEFLKLSQKCTNQGERNNIDAILQVSVSANRLVYNQIRKENVMCEALKELMKDEIQQEVDKEVEKAVKKAVEEAVEKAVEEAVEKAVEEAVENENERTRITDIRNIMAELTVSADRAMQILRIPQKDRTIYLAKLNSFEN